MHAWRRTLLALLIIAAPAPAYGLSPWASSRENEDDGAASVHGRRTAATQLGLELGLGELLGRRELYGGVVLRVAMDAIGAREPNRSIAATAEPRITAAKPRTPTAEPSTPIAAGRIPMAAARTPIAAPRIPMAAPQIPMAARSAATSEGEPRAPQARPEAGSGDTNLNDSPERGSSDLPLTARDLRVAIDAATRRGPFDRDEARLDDLSERARRAAALPELRLRATRLADASASLSPTSYDEDRTTSSEGASVWLEARAVWTLDRAIFASEELRVERLRQGLTAARDKLANRVVELVFAWQEAELAAIDPAATETECRRAWLRRAHLGAELDLLTGGWLSRRFPESAREQATMCSD